LTIADLCRELTKYVDGDIVDKTGIAGAFDIHLDLTAADLFYPDAAPDPTSTFTPGDGRAIATAFDKLGLQMRPAKGSAPFLVIDHVERPSENWNAELATRLLGDLAAPAVAMRPERTLRADLAVGVIDPLFMGATDNAIRHDDRLDIVVLHESEDVVTDGRVLANVALLVEPRSSTLGSASSASTIPTATLLARVSSGP
jgi:uncharacterized protein DUF3738